MKTIIVKHIPPTGRTGARVSANDGDGNRVIVPYDASATIDQRYLNAFLALCKKMGWDGKFVVGFHKNTRTYTFVHDEGCLYNVFEITGDKKPRKVKT